MANPREATEAKVAAVMPVKQLADAKQRLAGLLDVGERQRLFSAMVRDVLTALEACLGIDRLIVVSSDAEVADLAREYGAEVWPEPDDPGMNQAVTAAAAKLAAEGLNTMLFVPGDIPLVTADELDTVLEGFGQSREGEFLIVPAADLGGSNCVVCSPPDCMSFAFGVDSFRKHLGIARDHGLTPVVTRLPGIGLDIDTPEDLKDLLVAVEQRGDKGGQFHTLKFLAESGVVARLDDIPAEAGSV